MKNLSDFAHQLSGESGIVDLMEDLGQALNVNPDMLFLGGGNPARVPEFEAIVAKHLASIAADPEAMHRLIGVYQSPQGSELLIDALVKYFNSLGWDLSAENICLTNGSQSAFFMLTNILGGSSVDAATRYIQFPMLPEYLGYADQGASVGMFKGQRPKIELIGEHEFRYKIDFDKLSISLDTAALCVSSPSNPTANVLSNEELAQLDRVAAQHDIPLIIDCAYGLPFPGIVFDEDARMEWNPQRILVMSLSKLGLPGARTGIVVASKELIKRMVKMNTILSLANGNFGPALMCSLIENEGMSRICQNIVQPYYRAKRDKALAIVHRCLEGLSYRVHHAGGAFFLWLWFEKLPITSTELYTRLKARNVLVMDGKPFFFGEEQNWQHANECIRLSYCQDESIIEKAMLIIADELRGLYK